MSTDRFIISGQLRLKTPMAARTGNEETDFRTNEREEPNLAPILEDGSTTAPIAEIDLDQDDQPFISGSSFKGMMRSLASLVDDGLGAEIIWRLFGDIPKAGRDTTDETAEATLGGSVEFRNAYVEKKNDTWRPAIRGRTAIHEGTRTAEEGQLRHDRVVAPDTVFKVQLYMDRVAQEDIATMLGLLALLDGESPESAIGAGNAQGDGRIEWLQAAVSVKKFGGAEATEWLTKNDTSSWEDYAKPIDIGPKSFTNLAVKRAHIPLTIEIDGHFLISADELKEENNETQQTTNAQACLLYTSPSPRDLSTSRMPSSA